MAKTPKQQFVQARLKATGKEATPEQRAKFRQRFDALSGTKEGRTRIAQVILPAGDAKSRATLKKSLAPQKSTTGTTGTTGGTTSSTGKSTGGTTGGTTNSTGKSTSTTTSTTSTTLPNTTTSTTIAKNTTSNSSAVIPAAKRTTKQTIKGDYGDTYEEKAALKLEQYKVPAFGRVAEIGRDVDDKKYMEAGVGLAKAIGVAAAIGATGGVAPKAYQLLRSVQGLKTLKNVFGKTKTQSTRSDSWSSTIKNNEAIRNAKLEEGSFEGIVKYPTVELPVVKTSDKSIPNPKNTTLKNTTTKIKNNFTTTNLTSNSKGSWTASIRAAEKAPSMNTGTNSGMKFPFTTTPVPEKVSPFSNSGTKFPRTTTPVPSQVSPFTNSKSPGVTSPPVTIPKTVTTSPTVTVPKTVTTSPAATSSKTKTTVPTSKTATTTPATVPSPPSTFPMKYDAEGNRLDKFVQYDEGYKKIRPGDPKPLKPKGAPGKADSPSEQRLDYEFRLEDWNKFNPKRK